MKKKTQAELLEELLEESQKTNKLLQDLIDLQTSKPITSALEKANLNWGDSLFGIDVASKDPAASAAPPVTLEQLRRTCIAVARLDTGNRQKIVDLLAESDYKTIDEIPAKDRYEYQQKIDKIGYNND